MAIEERTVTQAEVLAAEEEKEAAVSPKRWITGLLVAFAILFYFHWGQPIPGLKPQAQTVLGIFAWFITVTVTDAMNRLAIGVTVPMLLVVLGGYTVPEGFKAFSSGIFFLLAGAFTFAGVMMGTPLGRRIAIGITTAMRSARVTRIIGGLAVADVAVGGLLPTVTEAALFLPIVKAVTLLMKGREHLAESKRIRTALFYMDPGLVPLFTAPLILTSQPPNIMLVGHLKTVEKIDISWIQWFWLNLPLWGLLPILFLYVIWWFKLRGLEIPGADTELPRMKQELGAITWPEIWAASCISLGLLLWVTEGTLHKISTSMVAVVVIFLLFLPCGGIKYTMIGPHVLWDTLFLFGGAISLGGAFSSSGAATWMADGIVAPLKDANLPLIPLLLVLIGGLQIARAGVLSASAMGAAFIPLAVGLAHSLGMSAMPFTLVVINCLSYAILLPFSIAGFFLAWGASKTSGWDAVKFGIPLTIISNIYVIVVQTAWLTLIGYPMR